MLIDGAALFLHPDVDWWLSTEAKADEYIILLVNGWRRAKEEERVKEGRKGGGLVGRNRSAVWIHTRHVNRISYIILKDIIWTSMNLSAELIFFQSISPDGYARYWIGSDLDVQTSIPQIPSSKVKGWDALLLAVSSSLQHLLFTSDWTISYIIYEP